MKDNQSLPVDDSKLDLTSARILVVDDDAGNLAALLERLGREGYTDVTAERDPRQAVDLWRARPFDLLLLGVCTPERDGCQVMTALKQTLDSDDYLPCIVLTEQPDQETRQAVLDAGAIDLIAKPFEFGEVLKRIETAINTRLLHQRKRQQLSDFGQRLDEQAKALREKEHDLFYLATHDSVTGLLNRRALTERLHALMAEQTACSCALVEVTNTDQLLLIEGVESVDFFLRTVSTRLKLVMDDHFGICGVWGGQTFLCVLPFVGEAAGTVFDHVAKAVFAPVVDFDVDVTLHGRGGYSSVRPDEEDSPKAIDLTVRRAGFALASQHKRSNHIVAFNQIMEDTALRRNLVERELNKAMSQEGYAQFFLQFQPKVDLMAETIMGCEALLRWQHPDLGSIPPTEFIPIAEEKGQIEVLGLIVIGQALQFVQRMKAEVGRSVRVAVNISGVQFELMRAKGLSLVDEVQALLTEYNIEPQQLELEITESVLMTGFDWVVEKLQRLQDMGISVALDDFGTGYSSFAYLQNLPISTLKIDRTFVDNAVNIPRQAALLGAIVRMAQDLSLTTVAEGVETLEDVELLRQLNCPIAQGYYYSRPLMPDDFIALLRQPSCARVVS
jgi:diguanylate cyclase